MTKCQILLTNDDGIRSPGLWSAARVLSQLGYVTVAAPRSQSSGAGRSLPPKSDGVITLEQVEVNGQMWPVHAVGGTPAQTVLHGILEIMPRKPDLVVSGINYGENLGSGITVSGTIGAALEAAALGVPALAVSLETSKEYHLSYSTEVDFSAAAHFTHYFARMIVCGTPFPPDVHVLKVDVPSNATPETPWKVTRLSLKRSFDPVPPARQDWSQPGTVGYRVPTQQVRDAEGTDSHTVRVERMVSVTPLSLDLTSRVDLGNLEQMLKQAD